MTRAQSTEVRKQWEARVAAFRASGQTGAAWCAAHDLKPYQLSYWIGRFREQSAPAVKPSQWLSVEVCEPEPNGVHEDNPLLVKVGQATVEVKARFNPQTFSEVVRILVSLC